jgi:superfamily II DNA/RNA helicase
MDSFRAGSLDALVTTDLMSRGIDVEHIKHVINFDAPHTIVDYEHRIGRTGRAGASGLATTLLTVTDEELFADLKEFLLKNKQEVPPDLDTHPASRRKEEDHINL